jgi:hypothetical protein
MATPLPPLPGETPEQRRARLSAADAVQARIDAQKRAELEAQAEARRKEMQARIDNMLRSAYVLPPLPQLPVPEMAAPKMAPSIAPMIGNGPLRPTQAQIDEYYATGRGGVWDSVRGVFTTSPYDRAPPQPPQPPPPPIPTYYDPVPPVMPPPPIVDIVMKSTPLPVMEPPLMMEPGAGVPPPPKYPTYDKFQPPVMPPVDPGFVMDIPTFQPPVMSPTMAPPPLQNLGEVLQRIQQKQPQVMPPVDPGFVIGPREPTGPIPTYYDPVPPVEQPTPPTMMMPPVDPGFVMDIPTFRPPLPTPEPYTPPMAEPYTPPSMQFSVDMPRMNYARDLYGVIPDNVSMLKRGGLAVKPKKGKC